MYSVIEHWSFKSNRCFGVEFEVSSNKQKKLIAETIQNMSQNKVLISGWSQTTNNNFWHVKEDSTCGVNAHNGKDYGWEIASYKAKGIKDILHIADVAQALADIGVEVNPNCGFHIHAEIADFTTTQAAILLAWWIKIEPYICYLVQPRRINNTHCKLWHKARKINFDHSYTADEFWALIAPTNYAIHNNLQKKVSLNFVNFATSLYDSHFNRKTVELRLPEGTLDRVDVLNWIRLYVHFVEKHKNMHMPENLQPVSSIHEFLSVLGLNDDRNFIILSKGLFETKNWVLNKIRSSPLMSDNRPISRRKTTSLVKKMAQEVEEKILLLTA